MIEFLLNFSGPLPYVLVFTILLACGLGLPIPEDITLFAAGLLSFYGKANVYSMIVVSMLGVLIGDSIIFLLGAKYGRVLTQKRFFRKILTPERLIYVKEKLRKQGNKVIFAARFMPGLRAPVYFSAGTLHLPYRVFIFYDGLASAISVPAIVYSVYYFGEDLEKVVGTIKKVEHGIFIVIATLILLLFLKWKLKKRKKNQSL